MFGEVTEAAIMTYWAFICALSWTPETEWTQWLFNIWSLRSLYCLLNKQDDVQCKCDMYRPVINNIPMNEIWMQMVKHNGLRIAAVWNSWKKRGRKKQPTSHDMQLRSVLCPLARVRIQRFVTALTVESSCEKIELSTGGHGSVSPADSMFSSVYIVLIAGQTLASIISDVCLC